MTPITRRRSLGLLAALPTSTAIAAPDSERWYLDGRGLALRGYDPVAYFQDESAIPGKRDISLEWDGAGWRFETDENRAAFSEDPAAFQPEYGGWCAEGIARGFTRISDPTVWVKVNGRLFLHYTIAAQNRWAKDIRGMIRMADENWPGLRDLRY